MLCGSRCAIFFFILGMAVVLKRNAGLRYCTWNQGRKSDLQPLTQMAVPKGADRVASAHTQDRYAISERETRALRRPSGTGGLSARVVAPVATFPQKLDSFQAARKPTVDRSLEQPFWMFTNVAHWQDPLRFCPKAERAVEHLARWTFWQRDFYLSFHFSWTNSKRLVVQRMAAMLSFE